MFDAIGKLGLKTCALDGILDTWRDSTGQLLSFFNWPSGNSNNYWNTKQYIHYHLTLIGKWHDSPGNKTENIICQKNPKGKLNSIRLTCNLVLSQSVVGR